ncbi:MAG TPA: hypothetical protein VNT32_10340 [Thermoleophilaceae bacterium]|nr:hypothetical protein [Thermoleophilaceae bacterium]
MTRNILIRNPGGETSLVPEGAIPTEAQLHEALARHPELVPTTDLGLGRTAAIGIESRLEGGRSDLVLLDSSGTVCIVEVKKADNPDTRRVIAQVLDYAASIWGLSVAEFESKALSLPNDERDLATVIEDELALPDETGDRSDAISRVLAGLETSLRTGDFVLAVAAPRIPDGVQRVVDYLGHRGQRLFGIEYSYFEADGTEIFVPRVVAGPPASASSQSGAGLLGDPMSLDSLLEQLPPHQREPTARLIETLEATSATPQWVRYGIRFRSDPGRYVLVGIDTTQVWAYTHPRGPFDQKLFDETAAQLANLNGGQQAKEYWSLKFTRDPSELIESAAPILRDHIDRIQRAAAGYN